MPAYATNQDFDFDRAGRLYADRIANSKTYVEGVKAVRLPGRGMTLRPVAVADNGVTVTAFAIRYHDTDIVVLHADGSVTLAHGGWASVTTVRHLNEYTPRNVYAHGRDILSRRMDAQPRIHVGRLGSDAHGVLTQYDDTSVTV